MLRCNQYIVAFNLGGGQACIVHGGCTISNGINVCDFQFIITAGNTIFTCHCRWVYGLSMFQVNLPCIHIHTCIINCLNRFRQDSGRIQGYLAVSLITFRPCTGHYVVNIYIFRRFKNDIIAGAIGYGPDQGCGKIASGQDRYVTVIGNDLFKNKSIHFHDINITGTGG